MKPIEWRRSSIGKYLRHLPRLKNIRGTWLHRRLGDRILHPSLWQINRQKFSLGLGIGTFFSMLPIPFQMVPAGLTACLMRVNIPAALAACWLSNPITTPFIVYAEYRIGKFLLGGPDVEDKAQLDGFLTLLMHSPKPIFVGAVIMGLICAVIIYPISILMWSSILRILQRRHPKTS
ncbi:MAG: DUF2062 domain-containing protein [Chthoniobacterales bacterium]